MATNSENPNTERYLQPAEAAAFIGISSKAITKWAREGSIPAYPIGEGEGERRMWRFRKSELDAWMKSRRENHQASR